jgi:hypothetical protein
LSTTEEESVVFRTFHEVHDLLTCHRRVAYQRFPPSTDGGLSVSVVRELVIEAFPLATAIQVKRQLSEKSCTRTPTVNWPGEDHDASNEPTRREWLLNAVTAVFAVTKIVKGTPATFWRTRLENS